MFIPLGVAIALVREIFGVPVDVGLAVIAIGAMLILVLWGSRPSVIAKYSKQPQREDTPEQDPPER